MNGEETLPVEGGLIAMHKTTDEPSERWEVKQVVNHDGTLLSQISAALLHGTKVVMGSAFSKGILLCDV